MERRSVRERRRRARKNRRLWLLPHHVGETLRHCMGIGSVRERRRSARSTTRRQWLLHQYIGETLHSCMERRRIRERRRSARRTRRLRLLLHLVGEEARTFSGARTPGITMPKSHTHLACPAANSTFAGNHLLFDRGGRTWQRLPWRQQRRLHEVPTSDCLHPRKQFSCRSPMISMGEVAARRQDCQHTLQLQVCCHHAPRVRRYTSSCRVLRQANGEMGLQQRLLTKAVRRTVARVLRHLPSRRNRKQQISER
mmetsp:Transcript_59678/g.158817  ORF Transcript_59678/g.158817 Transcript_59678/m.158817 type:complete len:254 (+) Transcript_59678:1066-1827(+)